MFSGGYWARKRLKAFGFTEKLLLYRRCSQVLVLELLEW